MLRNVRFVGVLVYLLFAIWAPAVVAQEEEAPPAEAPPAEAETPAPAVAPAATTPARRTVARPVRAARPLAVDVPGPSIPDALQPWVGWAVHDSPEIVCPSVAGSRVCRWPGQLVVDASSSGAEFSFEVYADRAIEFALPGNKEHWPQDVRLDGAAPPVRANGDFPSVEVPAGTHRISGQFEWSAIPEVLTVPAEVGDVRLTIDGQSMPRPRVDEQGRLWLRDGAAGLDETETDSVRASVYRRFEDGVPLEVTTWVRLNVSGRAREIELGPVLLEGTRPVAVDAQIPVQVAADRQTKVYVRPGSHDVKIRSVLTAPIEELAVPKPTQDFYDPQEVWVWVPNEQVRSVELEGLLGVDSERTSLPGEWAGNDTYLAEGGAAWKLSETRRGVVETQPNALRLRRDLWLDLDGDGYTIRDQLNGTLREGWRINYKSAGEAQLGRVSQGGENMLITVEPVGNLSGVELRDANLDLQAEVRVESARSNLHIVGWDHDVQSLTASLHLPPGWTLLGGQGVDKMPGTWMASWTLWDLLFVLLVAVVVGRLFGWSWAFASFLALGLAHGEVDAPRWVWIHLVASLALLRVLPQGWWRKGVVVYRWAAIVGLVVIMAPFVHDQVMVAFNPQVSAANPHRAGSFPQSDGWANRGFGGGAMDKEIQLAAPQEEPMEFDEEEGVAEYAKLDSLSSERSSGWAQKKGGKSKRIQLQQIDPNAVVQTGPGLPNWSWSTWNLEWNGPVGRDHVVTLWLLAPNMNLVLGLLRIVLLVFLGLLLLAPRDMYWDFRRPVPTWWRTLFGGALAALLAVGISATPAPASAAEFPDEATLAKLRDRIASATQCPAPCVVASGASIAIDGLEFEMSADVSAARATAWTLPGPADVLQIRSVLVDGRPTNQLRRVDGLVQVRLDAGNHSVVVAGTLVDRNTVTVQFEESTRPRHVTFEATDWAVDGISPTGVPDNSLQLTRAADSAPGDGGDSAEQTELPPWYQVERVVALGMPWQLRTIVRRHDNSRPQLVKLPLVEGEKVISDGTRVENREALVDFARGQDVAEYLSELPMTGSVKLTAPASQPWTETWNVECSRIWRCSFSELPPVSTTSEGAWRPRWMPWPGESLEITVEKPLGAEGAPKTVVNVKYEVEPGKRLMQASLSFTIRASQGDWQEITLPPTAKLHTVRIDGGERNIRPKDGVLRLPVQPGESTYALEWQQPWERSFIDRAPPVKIGSEAANLETRIHLGGERWLLSVRDDRMPWGPAVLFWWKLLLTLLLALLLGALPHMPLKWWEWGLIVLGMSQLPVVALLPVVGWFVIVSWRARRPSEDWYKFDLVQLIIIFTTLIALLTLYAAAHTNLVLNVDMQVDGNSSSNSLLIWYADRVADDLPTPAIVSLPMAVYRTISFVWALWAVFMIMRAAKWGWTGFSTGGRWKKPAPRPPRTPGRATGGRVRVPPPPIPVEDDDIDFELVDPVPPVERNARDGELVRRVHDLTTRSIIEPISDEESLGLSEDTPAHDEDIDAENDELAEDSESTESAEGSDESDEPKDEQAGGSEGEADAGDDAPPAIAEGEEEELGALSTDEVLAGLLDDEFDDEDDADEPSDDGESDQDDSSDESDAQESDGEDEKKKSSSDDAPVDDEGPTRDEEE